MKKFKKKSVTAEIIIILFHFVNNVESAETFLTEE